MKYCNTVLGQILSFVPQNEFKKFVGQHEDRRKCPGIGAWEQFILMLFSQASNCDSLRQLETVWNSQSSKWYHLGIKSVSKSTLSDANNRTNPKVYEELFYKILERYRPDLRRQKFSFKEDLYLLDGSIISLAYKLFDWAKYRKTKGAIRLHTVFCATEQIPHWINITNGKSPHEVTIAKNCWQNWNLPKGCILCFDRGYMNYKWWHNLHKSKIFWITKAKSNTHFFARKKYKSDHVQVISDEDGHFIEQKAEKDYPDKVRQVRWYDPKEDKEVVFLTNHLDLAPEQIAEAHKARWQIELFFKWIKQHLKIKTFLGASEKAVMSQVWIAMIYFVILAYIKAKAKLKQSLFLLSAVFSQALFEFVHLVELLNSSPVKAKKLCLNRGSPQLSLC